MFAGLGPTFALFGYVRCFQFYTSNYISVSSYVG